MLKLRRSLIRFIVALALCSSGAASGRAHEPTIKDTDKGTDRAAPAKPLPFEPDEQLTYEGEFSKLLMRGINIAEFNFTVERGAPAPSTPAPQNGRAAAPAPSTFVFKADADAKGWFRKLFGIDFHYNMESIVDAASLNIISNRTRDEQGKRVRESEATFDRVHNLLTWTLRNPNDPQSQPRIVATPLAGASFDLISAIYFLRTQPLEPGRTFELRVSDSGAVYGVPVRVGERKRMKTVVGRVGTVRVNLDIFGAERLIDRKGEMSIWFTDDARRLPVRARISTDLGTLDITLKKVNGGNNPARR